MVASESDLGTSKEVKEKRDKMKALLEEMRRGREEAREKSWCYSALPAFIPP